MSAKVKLEREKKHWHAPESKTLPITQALPFFRSAFGSYVHRVRSGGIHIRSGDYTHTHIRYWCGGCGFLSLTRPNSHRPRKAKGGELFAEAPEGAIMCATCEGRAIGAGCDGTRMINGRHVLFSPRV